MFKNPVKIDQRDMADGENHLTWLQKGFASFVGSSVTALAVTPLDVVKIRLQAQQRAMEGVINHLNNDNHSPQRRPHTHFLYLYRNGLMDFLCECNHCKENPLKRAVSSSPFTYPGLRGSRDLNPADGVSPLQNFKGTRDAFVKIVKFEGLRALWSGLPPTLVISIPLTIIYFPLYDKVKYMLGYNENDPKTRYVPPLAGAFCRVFMVVLFNPLELFRTKLQSEKLTYRELYGASKTSFSQRGFTFLFSGTVTSLLRDVPFSAIYWLSYESIKSSMMTWRGRSRPAFIDSLLAGAVSGSVAAVVTLPFDVIKTHRQIELGESNHHIDKKVQSTWKLIDGLYRRTGVRGLFAGTVPRLIKVAPSCAIMISIYEGLKTFFIKYNYQQQYQERLQQDGERQR